VEIAEALHERWQRAVLDIPEDLPFGPLDDFLGGAKVFRFPLGAVGIDYLGTLKIAMRLDPMLMVSRRVPTNTRLRPRTTASRQPVLWSSFRLF